MERHIKIAAALLVAGAAGCDGFLTGPGISEDPNFPISSAADQLLVGVQGRAFVQLEGQLARTAAIWTQQIAGINNQQRDWGSRYVFTELDINTPFNGIYQSGGLIDIRKLQDLADQTGDSRMRGIARVWEGFTMGMYTSLWGDLPYSEAVTQGNSEPALDSQQEIYAAVQGVLSQAITDLGGASSGALGADLIYNGDAAKWTAAANTLKARFSLHVAPRVGQQAYQDALSFANSGINDPPTTTQQAIFGQGPGDFRAWHGSTLDDGNIWAKFLEARADIVANKRMLDILKQRNDPRLAAWHEELAGGAFSGSDQFGMGGNPQPWSRLSTAVLAREYRQPFITWTENQLIKAEANFQLGNATAALANVNDVRARIGLAALPGPITLEDIMVEKWVAMFQNIDVYNDWRRTCYPRLIPGGPSSPTPAARVPGRYVYGQTERQQNPNFSALQPENQPADNWNYAGAGACPSGNTGGEKYPA